jgi:uncharacterized protein
MIPIPADCFNPKGYVKSDPATGLLSTRHGDRSIAIPELLLSSITRTLRVEAGEASYLALYTCGDNWGRSFGDRLSQDMVKYHRQALLDTLSAEFFANVRSAWAVHGLGRPHFDFSLAKQGLVIATIIDSAISQNSNTDGNLTYKNFSLEAGFLAGWFSNLAAKKLKACASNWQDAPHSIQFIIGSVDRIESIEREHLSRGMLEPQMLNLI